MLPFSALIRDLKIRNSRLGAPLNLSDWSEMRGVNDKTVT